MKTKPFRTGAFAALLLSAAPALAVTPAQPDAAGAAQLVAASRIDLGAIGRAYDRALADGRLAALHAELDSIARSTATIHTRAAARLVAAGLYWRAGEEAAALAAIDAALTLSPGIDAYLMKARLVELSDPAAATSWLRRAQAAAIDPVDRDAIALRLATIAGLTDPDALVAYARTRTGKSGEPLANALAILGKPAVALTLGGTGAADGVPAALRHAGWAAAAGDGASARSHGWSAYQRASETTDRRYALALVVEGYAMANDLAGAESFLATKPQTAEVTAARVDTLLELGRYPQAIALIRGSSDPALRQRLIGVLELAGDARGSETQYRNLIAAAPADTDAYAGLAAIYLGQGEETRARDVFRSYFVANRGKRDLLASAARAMIAMGLSEDAVDLIQSSGGTTPDAGTRLFLFRTYLNQGDEAKARAELERLIAGNPGNAVLADVADGYAALQDAPRALALLRRLERAGPPLDYDRSVQLATLAAQTGALDEALRRWRTVWQAASLPARRNYAEQQIIRVARQLDQLRPLTDESAARLRAGPLRPGELDLLVTLRLTNNDRQGALSDVRAFVDRAGSRDVAALKQAARGYARLNDYAALAATLRRLVAADPANRADYLQQLILTSVRYGESSAAARQGELDALLAQLPEQGTAEATGFRASVYAMAGLSEDALGQFRLAAARAPQDDDALLRLADALRKQQRIGEALALLQFAIETAADEGRFATALEGVLYLLGDSGSGYLSLEISRTGVLRWIERCLIERLIRTGDNARLQGVLADTAGLLGDRDLEFRVLDAALPDAGGQRAMLLRRLIALSSAATDDGQPVEDLRRKLLYARRLLPIRKPFPPDFYAEIATAMLKQGDRAGADSAFAMMSDAGALVNVDQVRGHAYLAAGMTDAALVNLGRALVRDQGNFDLLVEASILREARGDAALAFRWYWRGLRLLVARQPIGAQAQRNDQNFDFERFGPTLIEGALLNWPADAAARSAALGDMNRLFEESVTSLGNTPGLIGGHRRLATTLDLSRRIQAAGLGAESLAAWDARLATTFAADPAYRRDLAYFAALQGETAPIAEGQPAWVMPALIAQAVASGNTGLAISLAIRTDDVATIRMLLSEELASNATWLAAVAAISTAAGRPPQLNGMLEQLLDGLTPDRVRSVVVPLIDAAPAREALLFDLYRQSAAQYDALASATGRALIPDDRLIELMVTRGNDPLNGSARVGAAWGDDWPLDRFSVDQQLDLLERLVTRIELGAVAPPLVTSTVTALLARPLDVAREARLLAILSRDIAFIRNPAKRSVVPVLAHLLQPGAAPTNRPLLLEAAELAARRYPDAEPLAPFLRAWFEGDRAAARQRLDALEQGLTSPFQGPSAIDRVRADLFPEPTREEPAAAAPSAAPWNEGPGAQLAQALLAAQRTMPASVPAVLRKAWRESPIDLWQRRSLIGGLAAAADRGPDAAELLRVLGRAEVSEELARYLRAMDAETRHGMHDMYALLARALIAGGRGQARLDELLVSLRANRLSADDTQLLVALGLATRATLTPADGALLVDRLRRTPALAANERIAIAELMARSAAAELAGDLLMAALEQTIFPLTPLDNAAGASEIVASLGRWPDRAAARRVYDALARRVARHRATPAGKFYSPLPPF